MLARLINRAYLVSRKEYPGPASITLDWKWIDHTRGHETYADHLAIARAPTTTARMLALKIPSFTAHATWNLPPWRLRL